MERIKTGDLLLIYRTADRGKSAEWSSVATSICSVIDTKNMFKFSNFEELVEYCGKGTIFTKDELKRLWGTKKYPHVVKMVYNISMPKRIVRNQLIENGVLSRSVYPGFVQLNDTQFRKAMKLGGVNESFIINKT